MKPHRAIMIIALTMPMLFVAAEALPTPDAGVQQTSRNGYLEPAAIQARCSRELLAHQDLLHRCATQESGARRMCDADLRDWRRRWRRLGEGQHTKRRRRCRRCVQTVCRRHDSQPDVSCARKAASSPSVTHFSFHRMALRSKAARRCRYRTPAGTESDVHADLGSKCRAPPWLGSGFVRWALRRLCRFDGIPASRP